MPQLPAVFLRLAPLVIALLAPAVPLRAQVPLAFDSLVIPAPQNAPAPPKPAPQDASQTPPTQPQEEPATWPVHTWEMPAIEVVGEPIPALREEELVGPYKQPRWTTVRRFTTSRTYVIPEGEVEFEYWMRLDAPHDRNEPNNVRHQYEVEIGLPHRFQLDLYVVADHEDHDSWDFWDINKQMVELRYALADWGELWGNPTLYFELTREDDAPSSWEAKYLLGGEAAPGWHWSSNLSFEQETGGDRAAEAQATAALSKTIIDEKFSLGGEFKTQRVTEKQDRNDYNDEFYLGPSLQYKPSERTHLDFAPLFGLGGESDFAQIFLIFGYEF